MEEKENRKKATIIGFSFIVIVGFIGGILLGIYCKKKGIDFNFKYIMYTVAFIYIWMFIDFNMHEFGHFVFGKIAGFKLITYSILCFNFSLENEKIKFFIKSYHGIGGLCAMVPSKEVSKKDQMLYIAGGCIFNFLTIFLSIAILICIPKDMILMRIFLIIGIIFTLILAVTNALPIPSAGIVTDGCIFWSIVKDSPESSKLLEMTNILARVKRGVRFKELGLKEDINGLKDVTIGDMQYLTFRYFQELERENIEEVHKLISIFEDNLSEIPGFSVNGIYNELIYYYSAIRLDKEKANKYFNLAKNMLIKDMDINGRRTLCSFYAYIEENKEKAEKCGFEGLKVKDKFPLKGQTYLEEYLILKILKNIKGEN